MSLVKHSRSDDLMLKDWLRKADMDLMPYQGVWRSRDEIQQLHVRRARRSWLVLVELVLAFGAFVAANVLAFMVLTRMFS